MLDTIKTLLPGRTQVTVNHDHHNGNAQTGKANSDVDWKRFEKDDPESSTQATAKEQSISEPNASTLSEETDPVKDIDPATNATDAVAV